MSYKSFDVIDLSDDDSNGVEELPDIAKNVTEKKSKAATGKESKKQKVAEAKAAKKVNDEMSKVYKPGECMKYMNVEGHPSLWALWWCSDVAREVSATGARVLPSSRLIHPALVMFSRTLPRTIHPENGQMKLSAPTETCGRALYVSSAEDLAQHVCEHSLSPHLAHIGQLAGCTLTLVVFGVKDYFKCPHYLLRPEIRHQRVLQLVKVTGNGYAYLIKSFELDLLVSAECDTAVVNTPNELALLIVQFTKALAEAPHKLSKRACEEQAQFYMRGDSKKCVALDKDGVAVGKLWQQMIAILPHSSLETSRALCAKYQTPLELFEALQEPESVNEVADIGVSRAAVPGAKARRVGPEFARKLRILFTAQNGNELVN